MPNLLNLSKTESENLLNLRKDNLMLCLEKNNLLGTKARVALVLDYSGSMRSLYRNGSVQAVIERLLPIAMQFDDNGEMELWLFDDSYRRMPNISLNNYYGYVENEILSRGYHMGCTSYAPVMNDVAKKYMVEEPMPIADYVIFITDGENSDKTNAKATIIKTSEYPIFWQFVGIGRESFSFLRSLDEMTGRYFDNANFFTINDMLNASDNEIYQKLLAEFPTWLNDPKVKDLIATKYNGLNGIEPRGFFSRFLN